MAAPKESESRSDADEKPADVSPPNNDNLIPRSRLIAQAREFTGYASHEVAGALATVEGDGPLDPGQVKQMVAEWLAKPEEA